MNYWICFFIDHNIYLKIVNLSIFNLFVSFHQYIYSLALITKVFLINIGLNSILKLFKITLNIMIFTHK